MKKSLSALIIAASVAVTAIATSGTAEAQWGYRWHGGDWGWRGGLGWRGGWGGAALGYTLATPYYGYGYAYAPYSYGYYAVAPLYSYDPHYCGDCYDY